MSNEFIDDLFSIILNNFVYFYFLNNSFYYNNLLLYQTKKKFMNKTYDHINYDGSQTYKSKQYQSTTAKSSERKSSKQFTQSGIKYKTQVCNYWKTGQYCPFGQMCSFAHGNDELRPKEYLSFFYKTKACKNYSGNNFCLYGQRCQFIHEQSKRSKLGNKKILDMFGNDQQMISLVSGHKFSKLRIIKHQQKIFESQEYKNWNIHDNQPIRKRSCEIQDFIYSGFKKPRLYSL